MSHLYALRRILKTIGKLGLVLGMCWLGSFMMPREGPDVFDDPPNQKSAIINPQS